MHYDGTGGNITRLGLDGSATATGTGTIVMAEGSGNVITTVGSGTVVLGPNMTLLAGDGVGQISNQIVNQGLIRVRPFLVDLSVDFGGRNEGRIEIDAGRFNGLGVNTGTVTVTNGGTLFIGGTTNDGRISVVGSYLQMGAVVKVGDLTIDDGTLSFNGTVSLSQIDAIKRTNSPVWIFGDRSVDTGGGQIIVDSARGQWDLRGGTVLGGSISSADGTPFRVSGGGTLNGVAIDGPVALDGGSLRLRGSWQNHGTITMNDGSLNVGGSFQLSDLGPIVRNDGSVVFAGTFNSAGSAVNLDSWGLGNLYFALGSRMTGGTISGSGVGATRLRLGVANSGSVVFDDVTIDAPTTLSASTTLSIVNELNLNQELTAVSNAVINTQGSALLGGNGTITVSGTGLTLRSTGGTLTLGDGILVSNGSGTITLSVPGNLLINQGTISSRTAGKSINQNGSFSNSGRVEVRNGGMTGLNPIGLLNLASSTLTGGRWAIYANSTMTMGTSTITTNNADVLLDGLGSTFAPINQLQTNLGSFTIDHGRNFTTVGSLSSSGFLGIGTNSTLYVSGPLNNTGSIDLTGTLIVNYDPPFGEGDLFDTLVEQIGTGIFTSQTDPAKGIGSAENSQLGYLTFGGQSVDATTVLMMLTYFGDANLDGVADLADYDMWLAGYAPSETAPGWINGDFDYSGTVDLTDFERYLNGYYALGGSMQAISDAVMNSGLPQTDQDAMLMLVATVPEPAGVLLSLVGLLAMRRRSV